MGEELTGLVTSKVNTGDEIAISIRPEKIRLSDASSPNASSLDGTVVNSTYIGSDTHVYLDVRGQRMKVWEQNRISTLDPHAYYQSGQKVWLTLMPENTLYSAKGLAMLKRLRENKSTQGTLLIIPTLIFMVGMLIIPLIFTLVVSFEQRSADGGVIYTFSLNNYIRLLGITTDCRPRIQTCFTTLYMEILWRSLVLGFNTTVLDILLAFPLAYFIARAHPKWRDTLMFLVLVPMWTNFVIRVYAWMMILHEQGVINSLLGWFASLLHIPFTPLSMLYTPGAVLIGMVYEFLPFMILPIYTSLEKIDNSLYEAAADLGASPFRTFLRVTLPLSLPGMVAGTILVFVPVMGTFIVSDLLGGSQVILIGNLIENQFLWRTIQLLVLRYLWC